MKGRDPSILTADQVAAFLGISRDSVYEGAGRGDIPHRRVGKRLIFHKPTLEAWLAGRSS